MREIKFRAWNKASGLSNGATLHQWLNINAKTLPDVELQSDFVFMLFTGLLDRTGKEIYEGDILWRKGYGYAPVIWRSRDATFVGDGGVHCPAYEFQAWNIVGNVYENSELLA